MLNFDDYGYSNTVNSEILKFAPLIEGSAISVMSNLTNQKQINELLARFNGQINIHIDLVEGPFLTELKGTVESLSLEIVAQLDKLIDLGIDPAFIDFHQNSHKNLKVIMALMMISDRIGAYPVRPLVQSSLMRSGMVINVKNKLARTLQVVVNSKINFLSGEVATGLDQCSERNWGKVIGLLNQDGLIFPCHPHIYKREKMFCEYVLEGKIV